MNDRTMLVIGCRGQLGTDLCSVAAAAGYTVTGIDFPEIDLSDRRSVEDCIRRSDAAVAVNCSAFTAVDDCEKERTKAFAVNADGPGYLAQACENKRLRLIHISTDYIFDSAKKKPYIETDTPDPHTVYGKSKLAGEKNVASSCGNHQIFRIAWLYGLHGKNFVHSIRSIAQKNAAGSGSISVVNDQFGSPTSTVEVCRQIIAAQKPDFTGIFHATCEGTCTWFDFAKAIVGAARIPVTVRPCTTAEFPRPAPRPKNSVLENSRLKSAGVNCMLSWKDAFRNFLASENT